MAEVFIENEGQKLLDIIGENINIDFNNSNDDDEYGDEIEMEELIKKAGGEEGQQDIDLNEKAPPLDEEEIEIARQNIAENHPLKHTPLHALFPYLCCWLRCCKSMGRSHEGDVFAGEDLMDD
jgi:hypothetical protein